MLTAIGGHPLSEHFRSPGAVVGHTVSSHCPNGAEDWSSSRSFHQAFKWRHSKRYTNLKHRLLHAEATPIRGWADPSGLLDAQGARISTKSAQIGGKVVSSTHRPSLLLQEILLVLISFRGWVYTGVIARSGGLCQWKIPSDTMGIRTRDLPACSVVPQTLIVYSGDSMTDGKWSMTWWSLVSCLWVGNL